MNNGGCSHMCVDRPWGALCVCPAGYQLSAGGAVCSGEDVERRTDGRTCAVLSSHSTSLPADVDECKRSFSPCLHLCTNTVGSFYCHCREGFRLDGNVTCLPTGRERVSAPRLIWGQRINGSSCCHLRTRKNPSVTRSPAGCHMFCAVKCNIRVKKYIKGKVKYKHCSRISSNRSN